MFRICALTTFWVFSVQLKAQQDQFLVYDATSCKYETQNIENVSVGSDILDRDNYLETWKFPKDSLIASTANSRFSDMQKVERILHNEQFPASASLKIVGLHGDTTWDRCSGMMVGERHVLTAAHCVISEVDGWLEMKTFVPYLYVKPGFDRGRDSKYGKIKVSKVIVFKSYFQGRSKKDIALLELEQNIGEKTGWVNLDFEIDKQKALSTRYVNFSYPMDATKVNLPATFNGDTMYVKAGYPDLVSQDYIGIKSPGIPGESGSLLLAESDKGLRVVGVRNFSEEKFSFYRLKPEEVFAFKNLMCVTRPNLISRNNETRTWVGSTFQIYPNPVSDRAVITSSSPIEQLQVVFYDLTGAEVLSVALNGNKGKFLLENNNLPTGNYFLIMKQKNVIVGTSKMTVRK